VGPKIEKKGGYTLLWLSGTPNEMGRQQGELLHDVIADAMAFIQSDVLLSSIPQIAKDMGLIDIALKASYPEFLEECQGIVDTAGDTGFNMEYCLTLNFGDVILEFMETGIPEDGTGCSSVVAAGTATKDGRLLHSRNLDWGGMNIDFIYKNPLIQIRQPQGKTPHVFIGFPLNLSPYTGMNLSGMAFGSHAADPAGPSEQSANGRSFVQMLGRMLAEAGSLQDVRVFVNGEKRMSAGILVVSDGNAKTGAVFEMTASAVGEHSISEGVVYATNHFIHPDMVAKHAKPSSGSVLRLKRLDTLVSKEGAETHWGKLDETQLASIMRDPLNTDKGPQTLKELEEAGWDNDGSLGCNGPMHFVLFDSERRLFYLAAGIPPIHLKPYKCFSLEELLGLPEPRQCPVSEIP
jgi:hypothetical protein